MVCSWASIPNCTVQWHHIGNLKSTMVGISARTEMGKHNISFPPLGRYNWCFISIPEPVGNQERNWYTEELKHLGSREVACAMDSSAASVIMCRTDLHKNTWKHSFSACSIFLCFFTHEKSVWFAPELRSFWGCVSPVGYTSAKIPPRKVNVVFLT